MPEDSRSAAEHDRDRVVYSSAFRRLAHVTQTAPSIEGDVFHTRLSHSLKVAQVARGVALKLKEAKGSIDPMVAEAAALAHDLGHPPFGHAGERQLDALTQGKELAEGFGGNAQSFRIVTTLAAREVHHPGLCLCRATLDALLKYPRFRSEGRSDFGAYRSEEADFEFARSGHMDDERRDEAEIMDWADDVTYAVHDMEDFFRAGLIPLDRLVGRSGRAARSEFIANVESRRSHDPHWEGHRFEWRELELALERVLGAGFAPPILGPFRGSHSERASLHDFTSTLLRRYIHSGLVVDRKGHIVRGRAQEREVTILKELTWQYVIADARLASQQEGQSEIIRSLFHYFLGRVAAANPVGVPDRYRRVLGKATTEASRVRVACDIVAGMSEGQATRLHRRLSGVELVELSDRYD